MQLEVLTPGQNVFTGEVKLVKLPGIAGSFEILRNHAAIISALTEGELKIITESDETLLYTISDGVVEASNNHIVVLTEAISK